MRERHTSRLYMLRRRRFVEKPSTMHLGHNILCIVSSRNTQWEQRSNSRKIFSIPSDFTRHGHTWATRPTVLGALKALTLEAAMATAARAKEENFMVAVDVESFYNSLFFLLCACCQGRIFRGFSNSRQEKRHPVRADDV